MMMNLTEAYEHFKEAHPENKVGFSKFAELRPKECISAGQSNGIHVVCVCQPHQNVSLKIDALKKIHGQFMFNTLDELIKSMLCEGRTDKCSLVT